MLRPLIKTIRGLPLAVFLNMANSLLLPKAGGLSRSSPRIEFPELSRQGLVLLSFLLVAGFYLL